MENENEYTKLEILFEMLTLNSTNLMITLSYKKFIGNITWLYPNKTGQHISVNIDTNSYLKAIEIKDEEMIKKLADNIKLNLVVFYTNDYILFDYNSQKILGRFDKVDDVLNTILCQV